MTLRFITLWAALWGMSACSGIAGLASQATDTSDTGTSSSVEGLSEDESALYESGPVDLPVTIAKLDSVDADLVTVEFSEAGSELQFLSQSASEDGYAVMGAGGAVNTTQASKLFLINTETGGSETLAVEGDGSFSGFIAAAEGVVIVIAPMIEDETTIGPPIYGDSEKGVGTVALTNSDSLNSDVNLEISTDGYAYFSAQADDGTYTIYRRNLDGTALETIVTGIASQIRFLTVDPQGSFNYITQDGKVYSVFGAQTSVVKNRFRTGGGMTAHATFGEPTEMLDLGTALADPSGFTPPGTKVMRSSIGTTFVGNRASQTGESMTDDSGSLLTFIDSTTPPQTYELLPKTDYRDAVFDIGGDDTLFAFVAAASDNDTRGTYELYSLNMLDGASAWDNRTLLHDPGDQSLIALWMDVSDENFIVYTIQDPGDSLDSATDNTLLFYTLVPGEEPYLMYEEASDAAIHRSEWISLKPDSTLASAWLVTCSTNQTTQRSYLTVHRVGVDAPGDFYRITNAETKSGCMGAYAVDRSGKILFYRALYDESGASLPAQISFIDINTIDESLLVLDE